MIYLGQPYSHPDPNVRHERYRLGTVEALSLIERGHAVFAPITHWHHAAREFSLPFHAAHWLAYNLKMLETSKALYAYLIEGWQSSNGLYAEVKYAHDAGKPIFMRTPSDDQWKNVPSFSFLRKFDNGQDSSERGIVVGTDGTIIGG